MKITTQLKTWCHDHAGLSADEASDDDYLKAATNALVEKTMTPEQLVELTKDPDADKALSLEAKLDRILEKASTPTVQAETTGQAKIATGAPEMPEIASKAMAQSDQSESASTTKVDHIPMDKVYKTNRTEARFPSHNMAGNKHWNAGARLYEGGSGPSWKGMNRFIDEPSDLDLAISGAHFKMQIQNQMRGQPIPRSLQMTDHDNDLWQFALHRCKWGGVIHGEGTEDPHGIGVQNKMLTPSQIKAVLDDATSGGLEIAPIEFDNAVILTPLLHGEFFPRVNVVNITRGRRIEGASIGTVTLTSGGADATDIPLFNTASYITAFDTNIFVANGAIEIGLDFLSDSPVDLGSIVTQQYGQVLLQWLDEQVNVGDGTTEPEGVMNASGVDTQSASNGNTGPPLVGDYESMLFGIPKNFKQGFASNRITWGAREQTYQRARSIAVGAADERRVFGMDHEAYTLLNHPYAIGEFFTLPQINFVNWGRYRMYRRLGLGIKVTTEGQTLVRGNLMMISARARYGGQLEDGNAASVMTNAQS